MFTDIDSFDFLEPLEEACWIFPTSHLPCIANNSVIFSWELYFCSEISGFYSGEYEDDCHLGCYAVLLR